MSYLSEPLIVDALQDCFPSWLPTLTELLVNRRFVELLNRSGLTPAAYTTERFLLSDPTFTQQNKAKLEPIPSTPYSKYAISIEQLDKRFCEKYISLGLKFFPLNNASLPRIIKVLSKALEEIRRVPSLAESIQTLVRSVHILEPPDQNIDCSYSDPEIPFSIFLSIPAEETGNCYLRVAESLIHEAMHLQLTLMARNILLLNSDINKYHSPWLNTPRPANGILHGIYVFRVIYDYFGQLLENNLLEGHKAAHARNRRAEISEQLSSLRNFFDAPELASEGRVLVSNMLSYENQSKSHFPN